MQKKFPGQKTKNGQNIVRISVIVYLIEIKRKLTIVCYQVLWDQSYLTPTSRFYI